MLGLFKGKKKTKQVKILLVDDEPDLVCTVEYRLRFANYEVVTAANGHEGLERAAADKPDLILLDTNMPGMNGHEMLDHLRADATLKDIPVIMLTARAEPQDITVAAERGVSNYVTKPFDFTHLIDEIQRVLDERDRQ